MAHASYALCHSCPFIICERVLRVLHPSVTHAGTPLQNDLGELLALLRFLMPDLFGSSEDINDEVILGQELEGAAKDEQVQPGKPGGRVEE